MVELEQPRFICRVTTHIITSLAEAERLKDAGNVCFREATYESAAELYQQALSVAPSNSANRAIYYGNKAACHMHLSQYEAAIDACTRALSINAKYIKVLLRRSSAYEHLKNYRKALEDAKKVLGIEPGHDMGMKAVRRLEKKEIEENAAVKDEMLGKLKDLGNTVLGKFGVSLDDFKAEQDPETGSYSLSFNK